VRHVELHREQLGSPRTTLPLLFAACLAVAAASGGSAQALAAHPPPLGLLLVGGVSVLAIFALALTAYEAAAVLGFVLIGVVRVEPAPADLVFATLMIVGVVTGRVRLNQCPSIVAVLLGLALAINLFSFIDAVDAARAVRFFAITAYLIVFSVWLTTYATSRGRMRSLLSAYVWGAVAMSAVACLALFISFPASELFVYSVGGRAQGLFKDPNVFGPFLVPALLILTEEILAPRLIRIGRIPKLAAFAILSLGLLLAYSRAAWLNGFVAFAVLLAVLLLRRGGSRRVVAILSVLVGTGMLLGAVVAITGSADFLEQRTRLQDYDADRFGAQSRGLALVAEHPLGLGPGQFDEISPTAAHSLYVRSLAEQGVLGLAVVLLLLAVTLLLAMRNVSLARDTYGLGSATLLAAWCGILANSFFVDTLHWRHLWVVAALIWVGATHRHRLE